MLIKNIKKQVTIFNKYSDDSICGFIYLKNKHTKTYLINFFNKENMKFIGSIIYDIDHNHINITKNIMENVFNSWNKYAIQEEFEIMNIEFTYN